MSALNIKNKNQQASDGFKLGNELIGLLSIFLGLLFILSLATFDLRDPWLNHVLSGKVTVYNKAGLFGSYAGGFLFDLCGLGAWLVPGLFCFIGARRILGVSPWPWWRWTGVCLLFVVLSFVGASRDISQVQAVGAQAQTLVANHGGGILGRGIYDGLIGWLSPTGAWLVWTLCLLFSVQVMVGFSWLVVVAQFARFLIQTSTKMAEDLIKEHQTKKDKEVIELESDGANSSHFSLPSSLFGRKALQSSGEGSSELSGDVSGEVFGQRAREGTLPATRGLGSESAYNAAQSPSSQAAVHNNAIGDNTGNETGEDQGFSFDIAMDDGALEEKKGFFKSLFPTKKETSHDPLYLSEGTEFSAPDSFESRSSSSDSLSSDSSDELDLPPWVDAFEHGENASTPDETLRPDFSVVQQTHQTHPPKAAQTDPLLSILENYETSIQEQGTDSSVQFSHDLLVPPSMQDEASQGRNNGTATLKETLSSQGDVHDGDPAISDAVDSGSVGREAESLDSGSVNSGSHSHASQDTKTAGQGNAIPIRDKALDSVIESVAPSQTADDKNPPVRKKARLPLPPLSLLEAVPHSGSKTPYAVLESKAQDLMTCLTDFGIQGELVGITPGPVVTMFEVRPAPGVRVARIANLSDDLALALKAVAVRIQAPVPGTDTVGIEIPNEQREVVCLRQILSSETFAKSKSFLSIALGKDIAGHPTVADLATMPHLLVAGATGAGKSVGINSIILSLLYKSTPDEVRLLLVDPKRVEMAIYADLPHLVHPVVTEMQLAKNALDWAVREMDQRYTILAKAQVRNITDYNAKIKEHAQKPLPEMEGLEHMPYLVIIIDELADLMLTAAKEVETSIVRLAQLARAAGIHLILATQRPSVDVVTGIIKANFPCRIAFQVTSKHDSRTILDTVGAEHLLGKGDMLFKPSGGRFQRMHGAFVDDKNVKAVVDYWKRLQKPKFDIDFAEFGPAAGEAGGNGQSDIYDDPVYTEAVDFVCEQGKASISLIQRRFRIGFNKAARIIEQMEVDGIVGPQEGSKPRSVLR